MLLPITRWYATLLVLFIGLASLCSSQSEFSSNTTDLCYTELWKKNAAECLQILIEAYYAQRMVYTCPNLAELVLELHCKGCPWDRADSALIEASTSWTEADAQRVFHAPEETCRLAKHAQIYSIDGDMVRRRVRFFGIFGPLMLLVTSSVLAFDVGGKVKLFRLTGRVVPESLFMFTSWVIFYIGIIFTIASEDYYLICESFATSLLLNLARFIGYGSLLIASMQRYRKLKAKDVDSSAPESSWSSFVGEAQSSPYHRVCTVIYYGTGLALVATFIADIMLRQSYRKCEAGIPLVFFGIFKYAQLVIEVLSLTIYSTGYSRQPSRFWIRYCTLMIIAILSIILFVLSFLVSPRASTLIPHVFDADVAGNTNSMHALCVALLGLFEPLRLSWPQKSRN